MSEATGAGRVILAGTPLGNPRDASPRLAEALATAGVIAAEDTRRLRRLCADLGVASAGQDHFLLRRQRAGPGSRAARRAARRPGRPGGHRRRHALGVRPRLPAGGGRGRQRYCRHHAARPVRRDHRAGGVRAAGTTGSASRASCRARPASGGGGSASWPPSAAPWCSSSRRTGSAATLADLAEVFGADRPAAVCRELTKTYEQVRRGSLAELAEWAAGEVRGEITAGGRGRDRDPEEVAEPPTWPTRWRVREDAGVSPARRRSRAVAAEPRPSPERMVFDAVVVEQAPGRKREPMAPITRLDP